MTLFNKSFLTTHLSGEDVRTRPTVVVHCCSLSDVVTNVSPLCLLMETFVSRLRMESWRYNRLCVEPLLWIWSMGGLSFSVSSHIPGGKVKVSLP